jgi:nicotinate-nucleotide adenylyltransferase
MGHLSAPLPPYGDSRRVRIGLLGGSFNPAHDGHLHISRMALRRLALDQVWWLVSPGNPLKQGQDMADVSVRLASARAAARHPRVRPTDIECRLGTRYTVDTVAHLQSRFPRTRFVWLMGADNLVQFHRWRGWLRLARLVPIAVFDRPGYSFGPVHARAARRLAPDRVPLCAAAGLVERPPPAWVFLPIRRHEASATAIRARR